MLTVYVASLVVGGGMLLLSLFGDMGGADDVGELSGDSLRIFSIRNASYASFGFGGVGTAMHMWMPQAGAGTIFAGSVATGLLLGFVASAVFRFLGSNESGTALPDDSFEGLEGQVLVPIQRGKTGNVQVQRGNRAYELTAQAHEDTDASASMNWTRVRVVAMRQGTAYVAPLD